MKKIPITQLYYDFTLMCQQNPTKAKKYYDAALKVPPMFSSACDIDIFDAIEYLANNKTKQIIDNELSLFIQEINNIPDNELPKDLKTNAAQLKTNLLYFHDACKAAINGDDDEVQFELEEWQEKEYANNTMDDIVYYFAVAIIKKFSVKKQKTR